MPKIKTQEELDAERAKNADMKQRHEAKKAERDAVIANLAARDKKIRDELIARHVARHEEDQGFIETHDAASEARRAERHNRRQLRLATPGRKAK